MTPERTEKQRRDWRDRQAVCRARKRARKHGVADFVWRGKRSRLAETLVEHGILREWDSYDDARIAEAFQITIDTLIANALGPDADVTP